MLRIALAALLVVSVGCKKKETGKSDSVTPVAHDAAKPSATTDATASPAPPPAQRAQQILDAQVAALQKTDDAIVATFDPAAIVLVPDPRAVADPRAGLREAIARIAPSAGVKTIVAEKVTTGGSPDAVWISAEFAIEQTEESARVRVTELATADAGWKIVAAAFSEAAAPQMRKSPPAPLRGSTDPGPLTPLLSDSAKLAAALAPDAVVFGPDGTAVTGEAAKQLVTSLAGMTLADASREVHGAGWGYALGQVTLPLPRKKYPGHVGVLVIAVPSGNEWSVVAAQLATP